MKTRLSRQDLGQVALLTLLWGLSWPIMKIGVRDFPPMTFRAMSALGGLFVLAGIARWQGHTLRVAREHWRELARLGLTNMVLWSILSILGVRFLASGRAAILAYTMPVWAALLGVALHRERLGWRMRAGVLAAFIAVALLLGGELTALAGRPLGTLCMLGAAVVWAVGTRLMNRRRLPSPLAVMNFWMTAMALVTCTALALLFEPSQWVRPPSAAEWLAVLYVVTMAFGVAQLLWFRLASILPPVASGLSVMLIPVVGLFSGMLLLGERPTWGDWTALGCALISIGAVLLPARATPRAGA